MPLGTQCRRFKSNQVVHHGKTMADHGMCHWELYSQGFALKNTFYLLETYIHVPKVFVMSFIRRGTVESQESLTQRVFRN